MNVSVRSRDIDSSSLVFVTPGRFGLRCSLVAGTHPAPLSRLASEHANYAIPKSTPLDRTLASAEVTHETEDDLFLVESSMQDGQSGRGIF